MQYRVSGADGCLALNKNERGRIIQLGGTNATGKTLIAQAFEKKYPRQVKHLDGTTILYFWANKLFAQKFQDLSPRRQSDVREAARKEITDCTRKYQLLILEGHFATSPRTGMATAMDYGVHPDSAILLNPPRKEFSRILLQAAQQGPVNRESALLRMEAEAMQAKTLAAKRKIPLHEITSVHPQAMEEAHIILEKYRAKGPVSTTVSVQKVKELEADDEPEHFQKLRQKGNREEYFRFGKSQKHR